MQESSIREESALTARRSAYAGLRVAAIDLAIDLSVLCIGILLSDIAWLDSVWLLVFFAGVAKKLGMYIWAGDKAALPAADWGAKAKHGALAAAAFAGSEAVICILAGLPITLVGAKGAIWSGLEWYLGLNGVGILLSLPVGVGLGALSAALRR